MSSSFFYYVVLPPLPIIFWVYLLPVILLMCHGLVSLARNRGKKASCQALNSKAPQFHNAIPSTNEPFLYDNLRISGSQIRLLTITSTTPKITCQLEVTDLQDGLAFHALSYVWGDPKVTETIFINEQKVQVTTNLASALKHVPQHLNQYKNATTMKLWVDAICINQDDIAEKNHQLPFMKNIYSQADIVLCWVGPPSKSIHKAMEAIEIVAHERRIHCADGVDHGPQEELFNCAERLQSQVDKLNKFIADGSIDVMSVAPGMLRDIEEVFAFADSLQHATNVISGALQRLDGVISTMNLCWTPMARACIDVARWYERFRALTSKPGLTFNQHSRLIDLILDLLSVKVHNLVQAWIGFSDLVGSDGGRSNIEWLQKYPWLCDIREVIGEPPTGPIHPLFDLPYWRRVWIRQEITLAKRPVFVSGDRSISLETLDSLASWVRLISCLSPTVPQGFLKPKKVAILVLAYKPLQNLLCSIIKARHDMGLPVSPWFRVASLDIPGVLSFFKPNIWWTSPHCYATDPKDHFYGFLGLSNLNLMPDYSPDKSVGLVCQEFMAEYLRVSHDRSDPPPGGPLGPLMFAGHGHGWHSYPDMPSWGPNFPGQALSEPSSRGEADAITSPDPSGFGCIFKSQSDARIVGSELNTSIIVLDCIHDIGPRVSDYGRPELLHQTGLPMTWAIDFGIRHTSYVSGGHPLTALRFLLETPGLSIGDGKKFPVKGCLEFATFLTRVSRPAVHGKLSYAVVRSRLVYLCKLLAQMTDRMSLEEEQSYCANLGARTRCYNHAIAETQKGYVGRFPPKIKEGDLICVLNGLDQVAVLRQVGKYYVFIGTCLIAGMTYSEQIRLLIDLHRLEAKDAYLR